MACEKNEKKSQVIDIALFSCALFCLHLLRFMIESYYRMKQGANQMENLQAVINSNMAEAQSDTWADDKDMQNMFR